MTDDDCPCPDCTCTETGKLELLDVDAFGGEFRRCPTCGRGKIIPPPMLINSLFGNMGRRLDVCSLDDDAKRLRAEIDRLRAAQDEAASILVAILERAKARKGTADEGRVMGLEWYRYKRAIRLLTGEEEP